MKVIIMKTLKGILLVFLMCILWVSCLQEEAIHEEVTPIPIEEKGLTLEEKLMLIQSNGEDILTRSLYVENTKLQLKEYHPIGIIASDQELEELKSELLSDESIVPYYNVRKKRIELKTLSETESSNPNEIFQYSRMNLSKYLDDNIEIGMNIMQLTWECNSNTGQTICITLGDEIIYDHVIMNVLCISQNKESTEDVITPMPFVKTRSEGGDNTQKIYQVSRSVVSQVAEWMWGSDRGFVHISHTLVGWQGNLISSSTSATYSMSLGSADARSAVQNRLGANGYSDCYYGWYIVSPYASANISSHAGSLLFSVELSGIGSKAGGSGVDSASSLELP